MMMDGTSGGSVYSFSVHLGSDTTNDVVEVAVEKILR